MGCLACAESSRRGDADAGPVDAGEVSELDSGVTPGSECLVDDFDAGGWEFTTSRCAAIEGLVENDACGPPTACCGVRGSICIDGLCCHGTFDEATCRCQCGDGPGCGRGLRCCRGAPGTVACTETRCRSPGQCLSQEEF